MALFGGASWSFCFSRKLQKPQTPPNGVRFSKPRKLQKLFFTLQAEKLHRSSFPSFWRPSSLPRVPLPRGRRPRSVATRRPPSARPRRRLFSSPPLMVSTRAPPAGHLHPSSPRRIHPRPKLYPPPLELLPTPPEPTPTSPSIRGRRAELRAPAASTRAPPGGRLYRAPPNGSIRGHLHAPAARLAGRLCPGAPPLCVD